MSGRDSGVEEVYRLRTSFPSHKADQNFEGVGQGRSQEFVFFWGGGDKF